MMKCILAIFGVLWSSYLKCTNTEQYHPKLCSVEKLMYPQLRSQRIVLCNVIWMACLAKKDNLCMQNWTTAVLFTSLWKRSTICFLSNIMAEKKDWNHHVWTSYTTNLSKQFKWMSWLSDSSLVFSNMITNKEFYWSSSVK